MTIIHETEVPEKEQPGRMMRWLAEGKTLGAKNMSVCIIRVQAGETVKPAHCHPESEEFIYIISGTGRVMIEDEVGDVQAGTAVLFKEGKIHMLKNTGKDEMKVICFFAPATSIDNYETYNEITFPE